MERCLKHFAWHLKINSYLNMPTSKKHLRVCEQGHQYFKSSDCPTCPQCEQLRKPQDGFLSLLSSPARRALQGVGVSSLKDLARYSEKEILALHGMGPSSIPKLREALNTEGLQFKK